MLLGAVYQPIDVGLDSDDSGWSRILDSVVGVVQDGDRKSLGVPWT